MKKLLGVIALITLICIAGNSLAQQSRIELVAYAEEYPPFYFKVDAEQWDGVEVEIIRALCERAGYEVVFSEMTWGRALESMRVGRIQLMPSLTRLPEREEYIDYLGKSRFEYSALFVHKDFAKAEVRSVEDLSCLSLQIGLDRDAYYPVLTKYLNDNPQVLGGFYVTIYPKSNLQKTDHKRLFGFIGDIAYGQHAIKSGVVRNVALHDFKLADGLWVHIGVSRTVPQDIRDVLRKAYGVMLKDGTVASILLRWGYPQNMVHPPIDK